jgi:hypothetical protein
LCLPPQVDLCECVQEISSIHQVYVGGVRVGDSVDGYQDIVKRLCQNQSHARSGARILMATRTFNSVIASVDNVSRVTKTASFFFVPASRREWASTAAPVGVC